VKWFIVAVLAFAAGAALSLWLVCPRVCKRAVKGEVTGWLHDKLGLSESSSSTLLGVLGVNL
jgi:hypothetical protein